MEGIVLKSVRLIAADHVSELVVSQLQSEGIYVVKDITNVLVNIVLVSTEASADNILNVLKAFSPAKKNIVIKITPELSIPDESNIDSILEFQNGCKPYLELKRFLKLYKECVEIHGIISFDFHDFITLIGGKNVISILSYEYKTNISEALDHLRLVDSKKGCKYLLAFTVDKYDDKETANRLVQLSEYMNTFNDESTIFWTLRVSSPQIVTLFTSISIEQ